MNFNPGSAGGKSSEGTSQSLYLGGRKLSARCAVIQL